MAKLSAREVDTFVRKPDPTVRFVLIYGPDRGQVTERADLIAAAHLKGSTDPFALIRIEGDSISGDASRIADEVYTVGMFGGERVVRVRLGSNNIAPALQAVLDGPAPEATLIVEGGDLKGTSPVRKMFEASPKAVALPCYLDDDQALERLIQSELVNEGFDVDPEARALLRDNLGGDRLASRQELRKLALYAHGHGRIEVADVLAVSGDVSTIGTDAVVDAVASGEIAAAAAAYRKLVGEGTPGFVMAGAVLRHLHQLQIARAEVDRGRTVTDAMRVVIPPIFYNRQPAFQRQLSTWSVGKSERAAAALDRAILESRRFSTAADAIIERTLLSIAGLAKRRGD